MNRQDQDGDYPHPDMPPHADVLRMGYRHEHDSWLRILWRWLRRR